VAVKVTQLHIRMQRSTFVQGEQVMKFHYAQRIVAVALIGALPVCANSAETISSQPVSGSVANSAEMDLEAVGERIRETGAQIRTDLKKARARLEVQKAERQREAERARQQSIKSAAAQAAMHEQAAEAQARRESAQRAHAARQAALLAQHKADEQAARERAARALMEARQSAGPKGMAD
jgi:membrane protein involved in colicin uptake